MRKYLTVFLFNILILSIVNVPLLKLVSVNDLLVNSTDIITNSSFNQQDKTPFFQNLDQIDGYFTENSGQLKNDNVKFYAQSGGLWFTDDGVWFEIREEVKEEGRETWDLFDSMLELEPQKLFKYRRVILKQEFMGANQVRPRGKNPLRYYSNFFYGNDSSNWYTEVPNYEEVYYENLYNNIDLRYYSNENGLKYDFIVHPGGNIEQIRLKYIGSNGLEIDDLGNLIINTSFGNIMDYNLYIYQDYEGTRHHIKGEFIICNKFECCFKILSSINPYEALIIDPNITLEYSTYLGGSLEDYGYGNAIDVTGNVFITGRTCSSDYPTTPDANDTEYNDRYDVFITKLNPIGSELVYSTFIGGSQNDYGQAIAIDSNGNAFVTGYTPSDNFPITPGAYDPSPDIGLDVFVLKLNESGSKLLYSTYIGGRSHDYSHDIVIDENGNAYVTGRTSSNNFPTINAYDPIHNQYDDCFIFKLNQTGSGLIYSTYLGGLSWDYSYAIDIDLNGSAYVTGYTRSSDFPTTKGVYSENHNGGTYDDVFVTKFNSTGTGLNYSTFIGGSYIDRGYGISVDNIGCAYITGFTSSSDFPTTDKAFDRSHGGLEDVFISKLNYNGSSLLFSTYIGNNSSERGNDIVVDSVGNVIVTGETRSLDFPTTPDAYATSHNGSRDSFLLKLSGNGSVLMYSTFFGGSGQDYRYHDNCPGNQSRVQTRDDETMVRFFPPA